jgi:Tol biopolymer transport system component
MRYPLERWIRIVGLLGVCSALAACGDEPSSPGVVCGAGEFCECADSSDCPGGEVCNPLTLLCEAGAVDADAGDTSDVADVPDAESPDVADADTGEQDTADATDVEVDDVDPDGDGSTEPPDVQPDSDGGDVTEDVDAVEPDVVVTDLEDPAVVDPFPERSTQWIAFQSEPDGRPEMWVVKSTGAELGRIETTDQRLLSPAWSPDGLSLAFIGLSVGTGRSLRVLAVETGDVVTIPVGEIEAVDNPTYSWDARYIAFDGRVADSLTRDVFVWDTEESVLTNLTSTQDDDEIYPAFAFDGRLYFTTNEFGGGSDCLQEFELARMQLSVGEVEQVTDGACIAGRPAVDPQARFIVTGRLFSDNSSDLVRVNLSDETTVSFGGEGESSPAVSPDGGTVVFVTTRFGGQDVVLASATNGTVIRRLATSLSESVNVSPAISGADGSTIDIIVSGGGT